MFTIYCGYAFANQKEDDSGLRGRQLKLTIVFNPGEDIFLHEFSFGCIGA